MSNEEKAGLNRRVLFVGWGIATIAVIAGIIYYLIKTSQPPCASCHIEKPENYVEPAAGDPARQRKDCRLNGRIRDDWGVDTGPVFARMGATEISGDYPEGHKAGSCVDIAIVCNPPLPLSFRDAHDVLWENDLCEGSACEHCDPAERTRGK